MAETKTYLKKFGKGKCPMCGKEFEKKMCNQIYCGKECKLKHDNILHMEYAKRRYQADPEFRKRSSEYRKKYYRKMKGIADA